MKQCKKCGLILDVDKFSPAKENKDKLSSWCKNCHKEYQRNSRKLGLTKKSEEKFMKKIGGNKGFYNKYKISIRKAQIKYQKTEGSKLNHRIDQAKYRSKLSKNNFTNIQWEMLLKFYCPNGACICCGEIKPLSIDHVIPISRGGINSISNIQPICCKCNSKKRTKIIDYRIDNGKYALYLESLYV